MCFGVYRCWRAYDGRHEHTSWHWRNPEGILDIAATPHQWEEDNDTPDMLAFTREPLQRDTQTRNGSREQKNTHWVGTDHQNTTRNTASFSFFLTWVPFSDALAGEQEGLHVFTLPDTHPVSVTVGVCSGGLGHGGASPPAPTVVVEKRQNLVLHRYLYQRGLSHVIFPPALSLFSHFAPLLLRGNFKSVPECFILCLR